MREVLILYGLGGSDAPHWQNWLADELQKEGVVVHFPQLSDRDNPKKEVWIQEALEILQNFNIDSVITHSLGNILWFHLCNMPQLSHLHLQKLLLVAPPIDLSDMKEVATFFPYQLPNSLHAEEILLVGSDNDEYISQAELDQLARALNVKQKLFHNAGHLNSASGYGKWPFVKEWLMNPNKE